ncbi:uncharacterized protein LOC127831354 [Dreissena polymorpha]|nr:uncharacterized protein LOC127831354 [Dreissena polymorpha]
MNGIVLARKSSGMDILTIELQNFQRLPEVLYLQLDNSGKDNKNAFVLMFMAYLVKMKVFQKVKVGFLMVGHTLEDIDQVFSRVASWIRRRDMGTLQDLVDNLRDSQEPSPIVEQLTCYDYKHSLEGCRGLIQGIATPHHFIMTEVDGKVALRYRDWPGSPDHHLDIAGYIPQNFDAVGVTTNPKVLGEIQQMSADMVKWQATGRLSTTAVEWWTRYLAGVSDEREPCVPFVDTLPRQQPWSPPQQELATFLLSAARGQAAHVSRQVCLKIKKKKV